MIPITLEEAKARLRDYLNAEEAVLAGQSYTIAGRTVTRANLASIQEGIRIWSKRVIDLSAAETPGGRRIGGIPVD